MVEIWVWKWEYTDETGKRRVSRWRMTEHEALRYKDPVRLHQTLHVWYDGLKPMNFSRGAIGRPPDKGAVSRGNAAASGGFSFVPCE